MSIVPTNSAAERATVADEGVRRRLPPARQRTRQNAPPAPETESEPPRAAQSDYVVGYGRPPVHARFQPGRSGNPKGRPKGAKGLNTLARELLTRRVPVRTASGEKSMHRIEAVLHKTFELALKGNPRAMSQILSLYAQAVPEKKAPESVSAVEDLTATDLAILEEFKTSVLAGGEQ